jgi:hypothetical protein
MLTQARIMWPCQPLESRLELAGECGSRLKTGHQHGSFPPVWSGLRSWLDAPDRSLRMSQDGSVTSLFEMVVAGQRLGDPAFGHHNEADAVGQRPGLIGPGAKEGTRGTRSSPVARTASA